MNFVHIVGRLAKDPETRFTAGGQKVTTLVVATNSFSNGQEETIWWRVSIWGDRFDKMMQHFTKGKLIMVGGEMRKPKLYNDKAGAQQLGSIDITADYVKFVPVGRPDGQPGTTAGAGAGAGTQAYSGAYGDNQNFGAGASAGAQSYSADDMNDDEPLPF